MEAVANLTMEILQVADTVARDKGIDREQVLEAMEQAIQKAGRTKYGLEHDIRATIDRKTGSIQLARYLEVVEEVENEATQLTVDQAHYRKADATLGEFLVDPLPPIDFGRIAAQTAKSAGTALAPASRFSGRSRRFWAAESPPFRGSFGEALRYHLGRQLSQKFRRKTSSDTAAKISNSKNALPGTLRARGRPFLTLLPANWAAWRLFGPKFGLRRPEVHTSGLSAFHVVCGVR